MHGVQEHPAVSVSGEPGTVGSNPGPRLRRRCTNNQGGEAATLSSARTAQGSTHQLFGNTCEHTNVNQEVQGQNRGKEGRGRDCWWVERREEERWGGGGRFTCTAPQRLPSLTASGFTGRGVSSTTMTVTPTLRSASTTLSNSWAQAASGYRGQTCPCLKRMKHRLTGVLRT